MHRCTHRTQRGFTLIEMMVVVAIISVIAGMLISVSSKPYGANPRAVADQISATMNLAKLRAINSRRWHRVEVSGPAAVAPAVPNSIVLWQFSQTGMANPSTCGTCTWHAIQTVSLPNNIVINDASTTIYGAPSVATVSPTPTLVHDFDFRPDGSAVGGTLFLADSQSAHPWRVLVYNATGSSYARENW